MTEDRLFIQCPLNHLGVIAIEGPDAATFLQGQCTCDVRQVTAQRSLLGALCNPKGRVIATFRLIAHGEGFLMLLSRDLVEAVAKRLRMYVLRAKVSVADAHGEWQIAGLIGKGLDAALASYGLAVPESVDGVQIANDALAIRAPGEPARCLLLIRSAGSAMLEGSDGDLWRLTDIAQGLPLVEASTSEAFIPQMLNLDLVGAVSFQKGCYTGQEIVARTHYLGQAKRRAYRYAVISSAAAGDNLFVAGTTEPVGTVVNVANDGAERQLLAVVACEHNAGPLRLSAQDGPPLRQLPLPYDAGN